MSRVPATTGEVGLIFAGVTPTGSIRTTMSDGTTGAGTNFCGGDCVAVATAVVATSVSRTGIFVMKAPSLTLLFWDYSGGSHVETSDSCRDGCVGSGAGYCGRSRPLAGPRQWHQWKQRRGI